MTVLGTIGGNALLVASIAFGLTWVLKSSVVLFETIRWVGAAYLSGSASRPGATPGGGGAAAAAGRVHFWRGFLVALSNPKTLAFFTAFLPQFVDPSLPARVPARHMCAVSVLLAAVTDSGWAIAAGLGRAWFMKPARARLLGRLPAPC